MSEGDQPGRLLCPSAQPDWEGAVVVGVVGGTVDEPRVQPLAQPTPVSQALLELSTPVRPTESSTPCASATWRSALEVYWVPRSEWKITPAIG